MSRIVMKPPSQFIDQDYLYEEDSAVVFGLNNKSNSNTTTSWSCFGSSSDDSLSVLSSPVGSELGSTETETGSDGSSEEDYMAELSRRMAHYMLEDDQDHHHHHQEKASWTNSSPAFWPHHQSPKFQSKQALIDDQIRAIQYYQLNLKQDQPTKQYQYKKNPQSTSPTRAGSKANSPQSSCGGTGVFLPHRNPHQASQSRKKQGCSTVLIPARVLHALKQHFDRVGAPSSRLNANLLLQNDGNGNRSFSSQQQLPAPASTHQEIALPQEWTY